MGWIVVLLIIAVLYPITTGGLMAAMWPSRVGWILAATVIDLMLVFFAGFMALQGAA